MREISYCAEGHTTYFYDSKKHGNVISTHDEEGKPVVYMPVRDEAEVNEILEEIEDFTCLVCEPPNEYIQRIQVA